MNIPEIILSVQFSVKLHSKIKQGYLDKAEACNWQYCIL